MLEKSGTQRSKEIQKFAIYNFYVYNFKRIWLKNSFLFLMFTMLQ